MEENFNCNICIWRTIDIDINVFTNYKAAVNVHSTNMEFPIKVIFEPYHLKKMVCH